MFVFDFLSAGATAFLARVVGVGIFVIFKYLSISTFAVCVFFFFHLVLFGCLFAFYTFFFQVGVPHRFGL